MQTPRSSRAFSSTLSSLYRVFDAVATWVTQLSWWKFLLFAALLLVAGHILQKELFSGGQEEIARTERNARKDEATITIDDSGLRLNMRGRGKAGTTINIDPEIEAARAEAAAAAKEQADTAAQVARDAGQAVPVPPVAPEPPAKPARGARTSHGGDEVHIDLPPQIGEELSNAIEAAVDDAAEAKARTYHKQASTWFTSFVWLLVLALFGTKALVGGKKRAEAEMQTATAAAERESMQRQLSEAKMQTMQAQVEPHFLFNTLVTNLGREVDMVTAYLDLLKMRMEERLTVTIQVPAGLRSAAFPPMMLQSMVENAIKHGLECKPEGGHLDVTAEVADSRLRVTVSDDGVGFGVMPSKGTGLGLSNIRDRLALLHGKAAHLHIGPNIPTGVIATIDVPYQLAPK